MRTAGGLIAAPHALRERVRAEKHDDCRSSSPQRTTADDAAPVAHRSYDTGRQLSRHAPSSEHRHFSQSTIVVRLPSMTAWTSPAPLSHRKRGVGWLHVHSRRHAEARRRPEPPLAGREPAADPGGEIRGARRQCARRDGRRRGCSHHHRQRQRGVRPRDHRAGDARALARPGRAEPAPPGRRTDRPPSVADTPTGSGGQRSSTHSQTRSSRISWKTSRPTNMLWPAKTRRWNAR